MMYINDSLNSDPVMYRFISKVLTNLEIETKNCIKNFSFHKGKGQGIFFLCTEMSWIGLLSASIKREYQDASILTELTLYKPDPKIADRTNHVGRPDLLVTFEDSEEKRSLIIEAKLYEFKNMADFRPHEDIIFTKIDDQLKGYSEAMAHSFKDTNHKKISIVFEWIRSESSLKDAENRLQQIKISNNVQFGAFYHFDGSGVLVYGKVK